MLVVRAVRVRYSRLANTNGYVRPIPRGLQTARSLEREPAMATAMTVCVFPHYVAPAIQLADGGQSMVALHESIPIRMTSESTAQDYTIDTNVYSHMVAEDFVTSANLIDAATCDRFRTNSKKVANSNPEPRSDLASGA